MIQKIENLIQQVNAFSATSAAEIEEFRIRILGKKGELNALLEEFKTVPAEQKRTLGQKINELKNTVWDKYCEFVRHGRRLMR